MTTPSEGGEPKPGRLETATISFTVPLGAPITEAGHVVYLNRALSEVPGANPNCPGTLNEPKAAPGYLCVFTGKEENASSKFAAIQNVAGETEKASKEGAVVVFEAELSVATIFVQGDWAVTAP